MTDVYTPASPGAQLVQAKQALLRYRQQPGQHLADVWADLLQMALRALDVPRAGIWFLSPDGHLTSQVLVTQTDRHLSAHLIPLQPDDPYLEHLHTGEASITPNAGAIQVSAAMQAYLQETGVRALLDVPMFQNGELAAVVCLEDFAPRAWRLHEVTFALSLASLCMQAWDQKRLLQANERLAIQQEELAANNLALRQQLQQLEAAAEYERELQQQIQAAQALHQRVADAVPGILFEGILHLDYRLDFSYLSGGLDSQLGVSIQDLRDNPFWLRDHIPPENLPQRMSDHILLVDAIRKGELVFSAERPFVEDLELIVDGRRRWIRMRLIVRWLPGDRVHLTGLALNIDYEHEVTELLARQDQEIREQRTKLQTLLDSIPHSVIAYDKDLRLTFFNEQFRLDVLQDQGVEVREGMAMNEYVNPAFIDTFRGLMSRALHGERFQQEIGYTFDNGARYDFHFSYSPIPGEDGRPAGALILGKDISAQKQQEARIVQMNEALQSQVEIVSRTHDELVLQQAYLQAVLDSIPHSVVAYDRDLRINFYNEHYRQTVLRGLGVDLQPGVRMEDFLPPQYVQEYAALCRRALTGEHFQAESIFNYGENQQRVFLVGYSPIGGEAGTPVGGLVVTQDITAIRQQEQEILQMNEELTSQQEELQVQLDVISRTHDELALQRRYLQTLLDSLPYSVVACNRELRVTFYNERFRLVIAEREGKELREGEPLLQYLSPEEHDRVTDSMRRTMQGERVHYEFPYRFGNGMLREFMVDYTPMIGLDNKPIGGLAVTLDITERKMQEQEMAQMNEELSAQQDALQQTVQHLAAQNAALEAARHELGITMERLVKAQHLLVQNEKMASLGELSAGIAHEINNPLNFIHNGMLALQEWLSPVLAQLASDSPASPERQSQLERVRTKLPDMLHNMRVGTDRVIEIVRGLNAFARLDQGETGVVDLNRILDETLLLLHGRLKGIQLVREIPAGMTLICSSGQLKQVLMNLIVNAIEAIEMREPSVSGRIRIEAVLRESHVLLTVSDNGAGIAPEVRTRLFDPFFTTKPTGKGTGLGLAITYGIVKSHGGEIVVESEPGQGASFRLELPLTPLEPDDSPTPILQMV